MHRQIWFQCSVSCGVGVQYREVLCVARTNNEFVVLPASNCSGSRPANEQVCRASACTPTWFTSNWSKVNRGARRFTIRPTTSGFSTPWYKCRYKYPCKYRRPVFYSVRWRAEPACKPGWFGVSSRVSATRIAKTLRDLTTNSSAIWTRVKRNLRRPANHRKVSWISSYLIRSQCCIVH